MLTLLLAAEVAAGAEPTPLGLIYIALLGVAVAALTFAGVAIGGYFNARKGGTLVQVVGAKVYEFAWAAFQTILDGMAPEVRAALADGKVTQEEMRELTGKLVSLAKATLSDGLFKQVEKALGVTAAGAEAYVAGVAAQAVQARVAQLQGKFAGALPAAALGPFGAAVPSMSAAAASLGLPPAAVPPR